MPSTLRSILFSSLALVLAHASCVAAQQWIPTTKKNVPPPGQIDQYAYRCQGNDELTIDGETLEGAGVMVLALGNCKLNITNSELVSTDSIAIVVRNNARVTIRGSKLEGAEGAVALTDKVTLDAEASEFWGGFIVDGDGFQFTSDGSNGFWPEPLEELLIRG